MNAKSLEQAGNGIKGLAVGAGILVALYAVYKLVGLAETVGDFFGGKKDDFKADPAPKVAPGRDLTSTEYRLLAGEITMEQAEREQYPERFVKGQYVGIPMADPVIPRGGYKVAESIDWQELHAEG